MKLPRILPLMLLAALTPACAECDRAGCDAMDDAAPQQGAGIAGVVAEASDVVADGCNSCSFGTITLTLWHVEDPVGTHSAATTLAAERQPDVTREVSAHYAIALDPGRYLLCANATCIDLSVEKAQTLTANIKVRSEGPTSFFVAAPNGAALQEDFGF